MKSLSKILKCVDLERENPLKLMNYQPRTCEKYRKKAVKPVDIENPRNKLYEDRANLLLDEAVESAQQLIEEAKKEAAHILDNARNEEQEIEKEAFEKGYKEGYAKGEESGNKAQQALWEEYLKDFHRLKLEVQTQKEEFKEHYQKECLKLSVHIAEKILHKKIQEDGAYFLDLIKNALGKAGEEKDIIIRISPKDFERVEDKLDSDEGLRKINLLKDPLLNTGDCIIEGPHFEIDAGIKTQIQNINVALKELDVIDDENE